MKKRPRLPGHSACSLRAPSGPLGATGIPVLICFVIIFTASATIEPANSFLLLKSNCLTSWPNCTCLWKGGKFVADCSAQSLPQVPKVSASAQLSALILSLTNARLTPQTHNQNDYFESLKTNSGNNQMSTLNRDIQLLNLAHNNLTTLRRREFSRKKYRNLQKLYLNTNQLHRIDSEAFFRLTGLIELDLSENLISRFDDQLDFDPEQRQEFQEDDSKSEEKLRAETWDKGTKVARSFISHLTQLRQLNLNSNQLTCLSAFAFSPLRQLRQLLLSE